MGLTVQLVHSFMRELNFSRPVLLDDLNHQQTRLAICLANWRYFNSDRPFELFPVVHKREHGK